MDGGAASTHPSCRAARAALPWLALLLGIAAMALRCRGITAPWGADNLGYGGAFFSIAARNYLRYGYLATGLLPVITPAGPPSPPVYYTHHPPLFGLAVSASFAVFGEHEWSARLVPLSCSAVSLGLLFHLARRFYGERVALLTLAIATTLPLDAHLAAHVDVQGSMLLALVLAAITSLAHAHYAGSVGWFTLAACTDWPAFYLPVLLVAGPWPFAAPRPRRFVAFLLAYAAVLFLALAGALSQPHGSPLAVFTLLGQRALNLRSDAGVPFSLWGWFQVVPGQYLWTLCTPAALAGTLVWSVWRIPTLLGRPHPERLALLLLSFGVLHIVLGFQGAFQHEYWSTYLRAGVPLVCALLVERLARATARAWQRALAMAGALVLLMGSGLHTTLELGARPLSARALDADYTPVELAAAIRSCTPAGAAALTSDYYGEPATFFYADRPFALGVVGVRDLRRALRRPAYDVPGGAGRYASPTAAPRCFVLPTLHERYFPALAAHLYARYPPLFRDKFAAFRLSPHATRALRESLPPPTGAR